MGNFHRVARAPGEFLIAVEKPTKLTAAATSLGLSLLFMIVYGGCNWITAQRTDVGIWHYDWERYIPFVPWLIVPYMSIDLFFVAAPFLCGNRTELRTFIRRIVCAIVVAGGCFLLFPLTMSSPRPQPDDWTGPIFRFLHGFDQPYNLFPSLHITLRTILANLYARHTKGAVRIASHVWFSLIGFSTLLTYQHHIADIVGGFALGACCLNLFQENEQRPRVIRNIRVGLYYAVAACCAVTLAVLWWAVSALLHWPALSLAITAAAYWGLGPDIYRKNQGRLPLSTWLLFAPTLLGQKVSLIYYRRQCAAWNEVAPGVWIGARLSNREAAQARRAGVTAALDLTAEFSEAKPFLELSYLNLPVLDLTQLTQQHLREAADFIGKHSRSGIVYIHCKIGYSRSAAAAGAFLLKSGQARDTAQCLEILRQARPGIVLRPEVAAALEEFERNR